VLGFHLGATAAMLASAAAMWIAVIGQMLVLNRRLKPRYFGKRPSVSNGRHELGLLTSPGGG
jgi:hypothetical protein